MRYDNNPIRRLLTPALAGLLALGLAACGNTGDEDPSVGDPDPQPTPESGQTSFYSAAGQNGQQSEQNNDSSYGADSGSRNKEAGAAGAPSNNRQIEEGDIYRVIDHSKQILNLNRYRGLQVIDFSDPKNPDVIGRARISGRPVEMYLVGDKVYALLNNWRAYYSAGNQKSLMPDAYSGGVVAVIDISDPKNPKVTKRAQVPGNIETSRLTRGGGKEALFVVASGRNRTSGGGTIQPTRSTSGSTTYVRSFDVNGRGKLAAKSKLDLGGNVADIQGVENHLLVARDVRDKNHNHTGSKVSVIDISNPSGKMREGSQVKVKGRVQNKHNMDLHNGILRVVSGATWNGAQENHIETFDASNIENLTKIDHTSFAKGERLEATLFMGEKAFFVTYEQIDPLFAFHIDKKGKLEQKSEFEITGWNDYFVPVEDGKRLIGIGMNDEEGFTMAVSLYDSTDLSNKKPFIAREEVPMDYSRSEANRDDRAFSVLENATKVKAKDGTVETGLVLLPFQGWDRKNHEYKSGVQIFTFSDKTLTRRGTMDHGTPVRRSFMAERDKDLTGNLSEAELSLFDTSKPDKPSEVGRVELAPNYNDYWKFGKYAVRRDSRRAYYYWYGSRGNQQKTDTLEIISAAQHPDEADTITQISIPAGAQVIRNGDNLVVAEMEATNKTRNNSSWTNSRIYKTDLTVWDFSNPKSPKPVQTLSTKKLMPHYAYNYYRNYYGGRGGVAVDASVAGRGYYYGGGNLKAHAVENALVFISQVRERKLKGTMRTTRTRPKSYRAGSCSTQGNVRRCPYYNGAITCNQLVKPDGTKRPEHCTGAIRKCTYNKDGHRECHKVDASKIATETDTYKRKHYEYWKRYRFHSLDLSSPSKAKLGSGTTMPKSEHDVTYLVDGSTFYLTHRKPYNLPNDTRAYYRYFFRTVDFSKPAKPKAGKSINIPGRLIEVDGDTIITRDYLWGRHIVENSLNKLKVKNGKAYLKASHRLKDRQVQNIVLDGGGHVLVSHRLAWRVDQPHPVYHRAEAGSGSKSEPDHGTYMSVLDLGKGLKELSYARVDDWATLRTARKQRALFSVPGGLLVVNLQKPTSPVAQSYFPIQGWPRDLKVDGKDITMAAGRYGIYEFSLDTSNLLHN